MNYPKQERFATKTRQVHLESQSMNSGFPGTMVYLIQMKFLCNQDKEAAFLLFPLSFNYEINLKPFILTGFPPPMLLRVLEISLLNTNCQESQKPSFSLLLCQWACCQGTGECFAHLETQPFNLLVALNYFLLLLNFPTWVRTSHSRTRKCPQGPKLGSLDCGLT